MVGAIGVNIGVEEDGKNIHFERPILIVKKFNEKMFWGVLLSSREKTGIFYQEISHEGGKSWVLLSQFGTFSSKRLLRKIGSISEDQFKLVRKRLKEFL